MEVSSEFPVGRELESGALLHVDRAADALVLDGPERRAVMRTQVAIGRLSAKELFARPLEFIGTQQTADMIRAERRAKGLTLLRGR